ncbi:expressed unknown protein [Seminavis robusta]|uniref:Uncharacterized protein n=1 Tax=Seminavis robusta TaxID=568900 RepID=A0A9N8HJM1_9STRA|nr:expressed unknown protein [Seminavis robusta]|eukprot:Sro698_g189310.1 n/a (127) ;mRNA; f:43434-43892
MTGSRRVLEQHSHGERPHTGNKFFGGGHSTLFQAQSIYSLWETYVQRSSDADEADDVKLGPVSSSEVNQEVGPSQVGFGEPLEAPPPFASLPIDAEGDRAANDNTDTEEDDDTTMRRPMKRRRRRR